MCTRLFGCVDFLRPTLTAASHCTRLCYKRCWIKNLFTMFTILINKLYLADWNLRVRSNVLSCFINSKFLQECNQLLSWTQQRKVWNDLDSTITIKMFFAKISKLYKEAYLAPDYTRDWRWILYERAWSMVTLRLIKQCKTVGNSLNDL